MSVPVTKFSIAVMQFFGWHPALTHSSSEQHIIVVCVAFIASKLCVCILKDSACRLCAFW